MNMDGMSEDRLDDYRGHIEVHSSSIDDQNQAHYDLQNRIRIIMIAVASVAAILIFLLVYVFNTSPDRSSFIMKTVVAIFMIASVILFGLRVLREFLVDRHERAKGKVSMRYAPMFDFDMTPEEFIKANKPKDDETSTD